MRKKLLLSSIIVLILFGVYWGVTWYRFSQKILTITFCDVGQGDGILLLSPEKYTVLIDSGASDAVLSCLDRHLPFWEHTLSLGILTHPHLDHFQGFIGVLDQYTLSRFALERLKNNIESYRIFEKSLIDTHTSQQIVASGDRFNTPDGLLIEVLHPTEQALLLKSPQGYITDTKEFSSLILRVSYKEFSMLLTGDSQREQVKEAVATYHLSSIDVLQVPHHGSRTGLDAAILDRLHPRVGIISVGKNSYGHPSADIIKILRDYDITILRTDQQGDIEIQTNGKTWKVKS